MKQGQTLTMQLSLFVALNCRRGGMAHRFLNQDNLREVMPNNLVCPFWRNFFFFKKHVHTNEMIKQALSS